MQLDINDRDPLTIVLWKCIHIFNKKCHVRESIMVELSLDGSLTYFHGHI